ncbi:aspartate-semialdehyde dehydrogenase [Magnaporthiopsis poae ATCC 64411]|uniref:Aspartate-semialdehyde dehydrogenase n=1 Tax=Magnaporthiopsis poae (strain ATCC 64411 / 73-15) TaxID=644358 RepID=A0A0C4DQL6_MAGP6|nr:aspartate-semialdehyde dehydrogenase [Magnaporthiopsis poae ATCC 64411]
MQAVSGAGYPGVASMDVVDNVVPFIKGEEDKLETEARKILGGLSADATAFEEQSALRVSAACNRVPVLDGHTACVSLRFANRPPPPAAEVKAALASYVSEAESLGCPSAPKPSIMVFEEDDRPQPRLDRDLSGGYTVSVGRVREDESGIFDIKFVALSHNSCRRKTRGRWHKVRTRILYVYICRGGQDREWKGCQVGQSLWFGLAPDEARPLLLFFVLPFVHALARVMPRLVRVRGRTGFGEAHDDYSIRTLASLSHYHDFLSRSVRTYIAHDPISPEKRPRDSYQLIGTGVVTLPKSESSWVGEKGEITIPGRRKLRDEGSGYLRR